MKRRLGRPNSNSWTDDAQHDPGTTLLELLAYLGDLLSYRQDQIANEARLTTRRRAGILLLTLVSLVAWRCRGSIKGHVDRCRSAQ